VNREASRLRILLPLGSGEGLYEVRIVTLLGKSLATASGMASVKNSVTTLQVVMNLSSISPGTDVLKIRKEGQEWNSYPLAVH